MEGFGLLTPSPPPLLRTVLDGHSIGRFVQCTCWIEGREMSGDETRRKE